ncbi:CLUMA_CG016621, isoform A [Clunio marinus]|uniref:CLUMA_CG016621, isoform A n=1 Tax=Clunio marinus TaxID=568069 RepID=A0A1J1IX13_9DIPT|nr:CLUMA_CG016621, isoform A [Clunio marinus]
MKLSNISFRIDLSGAHLICEFSAVGHLPISDWLWSDEIPKRWEKLASHRKTTCNRCIDYYAKENLSSTLHF